MKRTSTVELLDAAYDGEGLVLPAVKLGRMTRKEYDELMGEPAWDKYKVLRQWFAQFVVLAEGGDL